MDNFKLTAPVTQTRAIAVEGKVKVGPNHMIFSGAEIEWAAYIAKTLREKGIRKGWTPSFGGEEGDELRAHLIGAFGEIAVAKRFDLAFPRDYLERLNRPDFGTCLSVRTTPELYFPKLRVRPKDDGASVYILGILIPKSAAVPPGVFLHAWAWGEHIKKSVALTDPGNRGKPVHLAPMSTPGMNFEIDKIPERVLATCERNYRVWWGDR